MSFYDGPNGEYADMPIINGHYALNASKTAAVEDNRGFGFQLYPSKTYYERGNCLNTRLLIICRSEYLVCTLVLFNWIENTRPSDYSNIS